MPLSRRMLGRLQHADDAFAELRKRYLARRGAIYATVGGLGEAQRITGPQAPP